MDRDAFYGARGGAWFADQQALGGLEEFDFVVGWPRHFVAVQVKSTIFELEEGWMCTVCSSSHPYPPGSFDFLAAYIVFEDAWYIIPEAEILGMKSVSLHTNNSHSKYEKYRENWELLERAGGKVPSRATSKTFKVAPKNFRRCGLSKRDRIPLQRLSY
jgi:hypothetical protein